MRRRIGFALAAMVVLLSGPFAFAQGPDYPIRPLKFLVPYPPGGGTDVVARIVSERFARQIGQPVIIENRGGAGGSLGTELAAKSAPDGYTVLVTLSSHTINPAFYPRLNYDVERDFEAVTQIASLPQILVANTSVHADNLKQLVDSARSWPGKLSYASVGTGSPGHLAGELLKLKSGVDMVHVPYKGGGPAITDVIGGQVPLLWVSIPAAAPFIKNGKLKAIAVSTLKRSASFPDVPTVAESGYPDFEVDSWYAMFVPARTPVAIVTRLRQTMIDTLADQTVRDRLLDQGAEPVGGTAQALDAIVKSELVKWKQLVIDAKLKLD